MTSQKPDKALTCADLLSGHQAFLTVEALKGIADTTVKNLIDLHTTGTCANLVEK